jgi:hypothetical protein
MGCNCHNDSTPLSLKQKVRRDFKKKAAEVKRLWQESSSDGKITSDKDQLGFKPVE